ncbi:NtrZ family periplasmic regulatory protein [Brevundimonas sp.]|uniref:NtrZ family periplasmic regulatory protein n=1 Tax=Brevundimonas sp. TaxID=1871086 RepID=UPI00356633C2
MRKNGAFIVGLVSGLALLTLADVASAQTAGSRTPAVSLSEAQAARAAAAPPTGPSRLRFTERGRWGLDLNLSQPVGRERDLGDVEAGAYYRVNPRLRVGAAAGLAEPEADPARAPQSSDRRAAPRFRLESIFRF